MKRHSICGCLAGLMASLATAHAAETWHCDQSPLIIENVRLLEGQETKTVIIADGLIQWIGDSDKLTGDDAQSSRHIDGKGALMLPGLIDSHTHFDALPAAKPLQRELDVQTEIFPITMRQTLASGVTTARAHLAALGDMALMQTLSADNCAPVPRIILSGPGLLGGAPDVDGRLMRGVESPEDAAAKVKELAKLGASWVALHGITRFSDDELAAIIKTSAQENLKLMADTDSFENLETALNQPIISGEYINRSTATEYPDAIIDALKAREPNFYIVAPIGYYARSNRFAKNNMPPLTDELFSFVPVEIAAAMRNQFQEAFENDAYIAGAIAAFPTFQRKFDQLRNAGAKLAIGSDNGSLGQFHHDAVWQEMATWFAMGATPAEILIGATATPAQMVDRSDIGTLSVGAAADIVLYRGEMEAGTFDREFVDTVIKGGVIFAADGEWVGPDTAQMTTKIEALRGGLPH